jgi:hypothetical protein
VERLHKRGFPGARVHLDDLPARVRVQVDLMPAAVLGPVGGVIIEADDLALSRGGLGDIPRVVLEGKLDVLAEGEVAVLASEAPDQVSGGAVDLVDGIGVTGGDQIRAFVVLVDRVDMEVVPGVGAVVP